MKKLFLFVVILLAAPHAFAQKIELKAKVDERCELLSTVFRLAEAKEYLTHYIPVYVDSVDKYFEPHKDHELIDFCRSFRENYGVAYDAPMSLAIHLQIVDEKISLIPDVKESSLDDRWDRGELPRFIELLNNFYTDTKFHDFFVSQKGFIDKVEQAANQYFKKIDMEWFRDFYGEVPQGSYNLVISLSNGSTNYGPKVQYTDGREEMYSITICAIDSLNNPYFSDRWSLNLVTHEFAHSFCNHLIDENYDRMEKKASEFYRLNEEQLRELACGSPRALLYEMLVRASVIKYMEAHYPIRLEKYFIREKSDGFVWIEELYNSLSEYEKQRDKYPTLRSYMPEIAKAQNKLNPKKMVAKLNKLIPKMSILNIENGQQDVDATTTTQIIVKFSAKMYTGANGLTYGSKGEEYYPEIISAKWNKKTKTEWIVEVKLEPGREYSILFPAQWFYSEGGANPRNSVELNFKTKE